MDIRKLTIKDRNTPFSLMKARMDNNELNVLKKINFNNTQKNFYELESFVILMRFLKKEESFIEQVVSLTPLRESNASYLIDTILNDIEYELREYDGNSNIYLKENLSDAHTLTGYDVNLNIEQYKNCSSILINDFKTMIEQERKTNDFSELKEIFENKKTLMKSLILMLKFNNIENPSQLNLENEIEIISNVLSNDNYKNIKLNIQKEDLKIKVEDKIKKPKQDLKYRPKIKRRLVIPKPHL